MQVVLERVLTLFPPFTGYGVFFFPSCFALLVSFDALGGKRESPGLKRCSVRCWMSQGETQCTTIAAFSLHGKAHGIAFMCGVFVAAQCLPQ